MPQKVFKWKMMSPFTKYAQNYIFLAAYFFNVVDSQPICNFIRSCAFCQRASYSEAQNWPRANVQNQDQYPQSMRL